jgi:hypothetical protein
MEQGVRAAFRKRKRKARNQNGQTQSKSLTGIVMLDVEGWAAQPSTKRREKKITPHDQC